MSKYFICKIYNFSVCKKKLQTFNDILLPFYIFEATRRLLDKLNVCILRVVLRYAQNRVEQCVMRDPRVL